MDIYWLYNMDGEATVYTKDAKNFYTMKGDYFGYIVNGYFYTTYGEILGYISGRYIYNTENTPILYK